MRVETRTSAASPPGQPHRSKADRGPTTSPRRRPTSIDESRRTGPAVRRRSWAVSRRSESGAPSHARQTSLTDQMFMVAGPDESAQLRLAHEPFVQPGYADLNPSYEQPTNAKPVWSLAKPLPRVVRPGMVPTKEELLQRRAKAQRPVEHSQRLGLDVDPNELEKGRIRTSVDPRKIAAQVEDARVQRETNLMNKVLSGDTSSFGGASRMLSPSSGRIKRASTWAVPQDQLSTVEESEPQTEIDDQDTPQHPIDDPLASPPSERDPLLGDEANESVHIPLFDEKACPDDLDPLVQDLVVEEVHNNHTTWSVIRTNHREALAESLAVFVQLTIGFCADLAVTLANAGNPNTTAWAWGLATMMAIHVSGGVSGAHLNPAITVVLWFYRGFPNRKLPSYFAAQFIGAFFAALVAYGIYYPSIQYYLSINGDRDISNSFITGPQALWVHPIAAFFNEFVGAAILAITILALGDDQNAPSGAGMNSFVVGLVITCFGLTFSYQTGGALSPSRDFGPRLALLALGYGRRLFADSYWIYGPWVGAISGAFTGAFLYDFMVFTGGESPVNYPVERTQRAVRKSRIRWAHRLHIGRG
ncbi:MIP/aquaporin family protein [Aspergillus alliaceus]|uniref:MIP/aquaporin family protein n=1 Tax=Petromyces alliaceus TaxID=209559 RepID=UPI0012A53B53|nr:MIP transporter [Aspergillus alliaceus]KAB8230851.1 MIP transporter [Aspergillus alliaceus]